MCSSATVRSVRSESYVSSTGRATVRRSTRSSRASLNQSSRLPPAWSSAVCRSTTPNSAVSTSGGFRRYKFLMIILCAHVHYNMQGCRTHCKNVHALLQNKSSVMMCALLQCAVCNFKNLLWKECDKVLKLLNGGKWLKQSLPIECHMCLQKVISRKLQALDKNISYALIHDLTCLTES